MIVARIAPPLDRAFFPATVPAMIAPIIGIHPSRIPTVKPHMTALPVDGFFMFESTVFRYSGIQVLPVVPEYLNTQYLERQIVDRLGYQSESDRRHRNQSCST